MGEWKNRLMAETMDDMGPSILPEQIPPPNPVATPPHCFCGGICHYEDSARIYHGSTRFGMRWICENWDTCGGSVGAHPDGRPLGTVPDEETKILRRQLHSIVDVIWYGHKGREKRYKRGSAYRWLANTTRWPIDRAHIGMMDAEQCRYALRCLTSVPYELRKELLPRE